MPKYNSIEAIPAKTFFEILESKNYQLLKPKPREKGLEEVFISIYDDFFLKSDNPEANEYLKATKNIAYIEYKIVVLKQALYFYYANKTTEQMRLDFIETIKEVYNIEIDKTKPFIDEVQKVLTIEIGILENDLNPLKSHYDSLIKNSKSKNFDYYESIGVLSNVLQSNSLLKENMTLAVYVTLEKLANKVVEQQKKKK